jgi:hypothetical protein
MDCKSDDTTQTHQAKEGQRSLTQRSLTQRRFEILKSFLDEKRDGLGGECIHAFNNRELSGTSQTKKTKDLFNTYNDFLSASAWLIGKTPS